MNLTWGDNNRRRASLYVDKVVYPANLLPGPEWLESEWIRSFSRNNFPDPRTIPILPSKDIAYDELIEGIDLNPDHWEEFFEALVAQNCKLYLAVAWTWPAAVLPVLERSLHYSGYVTICPEWYLYPWRGSGMNYEAWQSAYWLAYRSVLNRSCPLYVVANRPDLGQSYDSFSSLRGLKGGQTVNLMRFQKQYKNYDAGLWGANYPAPATPIGVRDDAVQQFDSCIEIGFWT